jgi:midasin
MENKKCDDDAKSWWFIAYQVIIAAPLAISDKEDEVAAYAPQLLKDLETYFATAIQGQYVERLKMLKQFQKHLELLSVDYPALHIIADAVANFINLYARYEKPVNDNIKRGKASLEKAMKDVLLLASWKDTNIVALRDSAKRSHHKLFKIVRKYRALLSEPMSIVLNQGLPEDNEGAAKNVIAVPHKPLPAVDKKALTLCETHVPKWFEKSKRFLNVSTTVAMMDDAAQIPESRLDVAEYLDDFVANILTTAQQLQKATPSVLTEENKVAVKHLKTRKRKLFAETLRELREMGIKHNMATEAMVKQESLALVLSQVAPLPESKVVDFTGIDYYFNQVMDLMPRARQACRGHNEDLTNAEVVRSAGLLEGLLQILIQQRNGLASAITGTEKLVATIDKANALWADGKYDIMRKNPQTSQWIAVKWLPNILRVAIELVRINDKLGKVSNKDVLDILTLWMERFDILARRYEELPHMPEQLECSTRVELEGDMHETVEGLHANLLFLESTHPQLNSIIQQVIPWTIIYTSEPTPVQGEARITELDTQISRVSDSMLSAIQALSASIAMMPESTDDASWLLKNEAALRKNISSLHATTIAEDIREVFITIQHLDLSNTSIGHTAGAMVAVALPMWTQYLNILQQSVARYAQLNRATNKMTYVLSKTFIQLASQGFCTPSEKSDDDKSKDAKLEGGTGLGEGEGADDISKDIQDDEDLSDLAQQPDKEEREGEMEDEKDAVDMADGEMEGEMGEAEEKGSDDEGSGDEEDGEEEIDEEAGDVDDLDPNAVDEKMWDGDGEKAEKDQEGDQEKGKADKNEQAAADDVQKQGEAEEGDEGEDEEEMGAEQGEEVQQQDDVEKHDPHADQGDALDLPDDMELDGDEGEEKEIDGEDEGMDDLSDVEGEAKEEEVENDQKDGEGEDVDAQEDQQPGEEMDVVDADEEKDENEEGENTNEAGEKVEEEEEDMEEAAHEQLLREQDDDANADVDNAVPSEAQGTGEDQDDNPDADNNESSTKAQRDDGANGGESNEQQDKSADGEKGAQAQGEAPTADQETEDSAEAQPFKKLGDALEKWHRQQTKIREAPQEQAKDQEKKQAMDIENETNEFQHLQDDEAEDDAEQALGTATEEQAKAIDESMGIDEDSKEMPEQFQPDEVEQEQDADNAMDVDGTEAKEQEISDAYEGRAGAAIHKANEEREAEQHIPGQRNDDIEDDVEEVDRSVEELHIDEAALTSLSRDPESARKLWQDYENSTRDLSLSLTEQLRLILAPTLATKMRGDFRTGKRLNIKRIIPYIASSFKRDKIWMRRSVPSKRSYQIMLAVDDSKSMGESGSGSLAFETLAMVSKSLSMLEVGEISVLGFGEQVKVAHPFDQPFSADAGPKVFQNFGFDQSRTDVTRLVRESINLFREARAKASNAPADLWQLELIVSDGVCDSSEHDSIRRLLREAIEERIMIVFIVVDDVKHKKKGESVMDLKEAKFVKNEMTGNSEVKIERYLDTFPFQYYVVVGDVRELPGVLSQLLRQWFSEVAESSG